jgi:ssDNA-binding Zn-finger/Zn-ribbon topoisomerase 1
MRTCPICAKAVKAHGEPKAMASGFVDQIVTCPKCGWVGVISTAADVTKESNVKQGETWGETGQG